MSVKSRSMLYSLEIVVRVVTALNEFARGRKS